MRGRAIVLTLESDTREIEELAFSLGLEVVATLLQKRHSADPETFLGRGKLEEAQNLADSVNASTILVNAALKPAQMFNLVRAFRRHSGEERDVYDRTRLILEIFTERAHSQEARLQVELARLRYELPLVRESIHLLRHGERPGFLGGGAYAVDQYQDMIKRRMVRITADLARVSRERDVRRKHRRRGGFNLVSLAGYTNAGKSSLLQVLAGEKTLVENRYFSTLGTMTRRIAEEPGGPPGAGHRGSSGGLRRETLVTDTVGFIEDLPPWLVEAFHSTLEEIALADLILLVVDISDALPELRRKIKTSLRVLWEFQAPKRTPDFRRPPTPILVVFNKADLVDPDVAAERVGSLLAEGLLDEHHVLVSAKNREGWPELRRAIDELLPQPVAVEMEIPASADARLRHRIREEASSVHSWDELPDGTLRIVASFQQPLLGPLVSDVDASGGTWRHGQDKGHRPAKETMEPSRAEHASDSRPRTTS
jgi:GTP-binding protein HflX